MKAIISGQKLRELRSRHALTQTEFGQKIGLSEPRVRQIESGEWSAVRPGVLRRLAEFMQKTPEEVSKELAPGGVVRNGKISADNVDLSTMRPVPEIPTFNLAVAAGTWTEVAEVAELRDPGQVADGRFRIKIAGDSMTPAWPDGALVEFRCLRWGVDELIIGEDYYVQRDSEATFKRLVLLDEESMTFEALNRKKYPRPIVVQRADVVRMSRAEYLLTRPSKRR
jgi:transcriptional regulator with XRE-family HTH domain